MDGINHQTKYGWSIVALPTLISFLPIRLDFINYFCWNVLNFQRFSLSNGLLPRNGLG